MTTFASGGWVEVIPRGAGGGSGRPCEFNQTAGNKDPDRVALECRNIPRPRP